MWRGRRRELLNSGPKFGQTGREKGGGLVAEGRREKKRGFLGFRGFFRAECVYYFLSSKLKLRQFSPL